MRNLKWVVIALLAACGGSTGNHNVNTEEDLSTSGDDLATSNLDLSTSKVDMSGFGVGHACGAILNCVFGGTDPTTCAKGAPPASIATFNTFSQCFSSVCGLGVDGGPCNSSVDMAVDDVCDACVNNTFSGPDGPFVDKNGNPLACTADGSKSVKSDGGATMPADCGVCADQAGNCAFECWGDADCAGITDDMGNPVSCVGVKGTTTPGSCGG